MTTQFEGFVDAVQNKMTGIFAADADWGIGKDGGMPWPRNAEDMAWFQSKTKRSALIMGRKTYESLPDPEVLQTFGRMNIVISNSMDATPNYPRKLHVKNGEDFLEIYPDAEFDYTGHSTQYCIGGAEIFNLCKDHIKDIWITRIEGSYDCDTTLPQAWIEENFTKVNIHHETLSLEYWTRKE